MPQRLTRAERRDATRAAIVGSAEELFAERGFWGVTLDEIADRAGLTKGAVYSNFESKEDLLLAVSAKQAFRIHEEEFPSARLPFREQLRAIGRLIARASSGEEVRRVAPRELELATLALRSDRFREILVGAARSQSHSIGKLIRERAASQGIELDLSADEIGTLLTAVRLGLTRMSLLAPGDIPQKFFEDAFERIVLRAEAGD